MKPVVVSSALFAAVSAQLSSSVAPSGSVPPPGSPSPAPSNAATTFTFSLLSTNPTAVPLASIVSTEPSGVTKPLQSVPTPGSVPPAIKGAPPLPNPSLLSPASYPPLDKFPPTDSPEVQQWIKEVADTGIQIPTFNPTVAGGCPTNQAAAADASRCWWTCGGCTKDTDITTCPDKLSWGLTFDDGPAPYTPNLLEYLDSQKLKATFFVVGSRCIANPVTLQAEYLAGHQIAVHTWSHASLTTLTNDQIIAELGWTKKIIKDVLGITPNMMRPPFGDIDDRVRAISMAMGLTPVMWTRISPLATFDTDDFNIHGGLSSVQKVLSNWQTIMTNVSSRNDGFIALEHDLFEQSVQVATGYIIPDALAHQPPFSIKPVVQCLHRGDGDAYIETNDNKTYPPPSQGKAGSNQGKNGAINIHSSIGSLVLASAIALPFAFIL